MRRLGELADARAGDKGDTSILALIPRDAARFAEVVRLVTPDRIAAHFRVGVEAVDVIPVPALGTLTVVVRHRLEGGVTRSAGADPHGKTLSFHLLDLPLPDVGAP